MTSNKPYFFLILFFVIIMNELTLGSNVEPYDLKDADKLFENFVKNFTRVYKNEEDRRIHYEAFVKNLDKINKLNADDKYALHGINKFADYTDEEMKQMYGDREN